MKTDEHPNNYVPRLFTDGNAM